MLVTSVVLTIKYAVFKIQLDYIQKLEKIKY